MWHQEDDNSGKTSWDRLSGVIGCYSADRILLKISECYLTQFSWIVKTKIWSFVYMIDGLCTFPVRKLILAQFFFFFFPDQVVVWIYSVPTVELRDPINRTANPCLNDLQILWITGEHPDNIKAYHHQYSCWAATQIFSFFKYDAIHWHKLMFLYSLAKSYVATLAFCRFTCFF